MKIRAARAADYPVFAALFPELATGETVPAAERFAEMCDDTLVLEVQGTPAAYLYAHVLPQKAYIRHIVVDPDHRGCGYGRALMAEIAHRCREQGITRWCLNVKPHNTPAVALYQSMGMREMFASVAMRILWERVGGLPPAPADLETFVVLEDGPVEAALQLAPGSLAKMRDRAGSEILGARIGGAVVGVSAFDPSFPGAFPFRARDPGVMRGLLDAMAVHRSDHEPWVQLVCEGAPELARALADAGAKESLSFVHLEGPVPS